jgi:hypothetical protein
MKNQLKHLYGRRITPNSKIFMLVVIVFLGLSLAFTGGEQENKNVPDKVMVE